MNRCWKYVIVLVHLKCRFNEIEINLFLISLKNKENHPEWILKPKNSLKKVDGTSEFTLFEPN